jgi:acetyl esterase
MTYVDPDVRRFLDNVDPAARDFASLTVEEARAASELVVQDMLPALDVDWRDLDVPTRSGSVAARLYRPEPDVAPPLFVYFHGGGWELGSVAMADRAMRRLALGSGCAVLSVEYRRTPEHPFPAPLQDCVDATLWAATHRGGLGAGSDFLAVGGDSAGANLAAAVTQVVRDESGPRIDHQLLVYPVVTRDFDSDSYLAYADGHYLTRAAMQHFWNLYTGDGAPRYADLLAVESLAGLPPATVITCALDPLRSEGRRYAELLSEAGVATTYAEVAGLMHGIWFRDALGDGPYRFGELVAGALCTAVARRPDGS